MSFNHNKLFEIIQDQTKKQKEERDQWETSKFWSRFKSKGSRIYLEKILKLTNCLADTEYLNENERCESILTLTYVIISKDNSLHNTLKKNIICEAKKEKIIPDDADLGKELKEKLMEEYIKSVGKTKPRHKKLEKLTQEKLGIPGTMNPYNFLTIFQDPSYSKIQNQVIKESFDTDRSANELFYHRVGLYKTLMNPDITVDQFKPEDVLELIYINKLAKFYKDENDDKKGKVEIKK
jgi:hypothetical protein